MIKITTLAFVIHLLICVSGKQLIISDYLSVVNLHMLFSVTVSGQECTGTAGSLSHNSSIVTADQTFILAEYTVSCDITVVVVAWEFCYRIGSGLVTFYPGIWSITRTTGGNTNYALVQSSNVTYNSSIQTSGVDSCQRINLSTTDQFTAPAGSVVGLYSNTGPLRSLLLHTRIDSSITTYQFRGNLSSVIKAGNNNDVNYNIAIKVHLGKH